MAGPADVGRRRPGARPPVGQPEPADAHLHRPGRHRAERGARCGSPARARQLVTSPATTAAGSAPRSPQRRASSASSACPIAASRSAACGVTSWTAGSGGVGWRSAGRPPARCCSTARAALAPNPAAAPRRTPGAGDDDLVHLEARHGDALDHREGAQVDDRHLAAVLVLLAVGVAADQGVRADEGQPPGEPPDGARRRTVPSASSSVSEPFVDSHTYQRPPRQPGGVRVGQAGQHVAAGARSRTNPTPSCAVGLPPLVAVEAAEGAHVQGAVDDDQRVHVPGVGDGRALPHQRRLVGAGLDAPHGVVPARADVEARRRTSARRGGRGWRRSAGRSARPGVVGQQLARRGLLAGRPQHPPQPAPADAQARRRQVVEGLGRAGAEVVEPATPLAEPADQQPGARPPGCLRPPRRDGTSLASAGRVTRCRARGRSGRAPGGG